MAWVYKPGQWSDTDILTIEDVNEELRALIGEINGHLDRDNFDSGELTHAKFATDTFNEALWVDGPTSSSVTGIVGQAWQQLASGTITTEDGRLNLEGHYSWYRNTTSQADNTGGAEVGVRLDGAIVARSGNGGSRADMACAVGCPAVGAGTHTVELVARYMSTDTYEHMGGCVFARYVRR